MPHFKALAIQSLILPDHDSVRYYHSISNLNDGRLIDPLT